MISSGTKPIFSYSKAEFDYVLKMLRDDWKLCYPDDQQALDSLIMYLVIQRNRLYPLERSMRGK